MQGRGVWVPAFAGTTIEGKTTLQSLSRRNCQLQSSSPVLLIGTTKKQSGGIRRVYHQIEGERQGGLGRGRGPHPSCPTPARSSEPDRHPCRLRHQPVRRLRRA